jgi:hypothetical protein
MLRRRVPLPSRTRSSRSLTSIGDLSIEELSRQPKCAGPSTTRHCSTARRPSSTLETHPPHAPTAAYHVVPAFPSSLGPPTSLFVFSNHAYKLLLGPSAENQRCPSESTASAGAEYVVPAFPSSLGPPTSLFVFSNHAYKLFPGPSAENHRCPSLSTDKAEAAFVVNVCSTPSCVLPELPSR